MPRSAWEVGILEKFIKETDSNIWGAVVRVPRTKYLIRDL